MFDTGPLQSYPHKSSKNLRCIFGVYQREKVWQNMTYIKGPESLQKHLSPWWLTSQENLTWTNSGSPSLSVKHSTRGLVSSEKVRTVTKSSSPRVSMMLMTTCLAISFLKPVIDPEVSKRITISWNQSQNYHFFNIHILKWFWGKKSNEFSCEKKIK